ncbi:MAG: hypothetical protein J0L89_08800 [Xanthomonadales bacterium]|nr:hypothetical protein [Xanthomonadales bacterium]
MIEITLANEATWLLETIADCTNEGPACYSCPHFDQCDHHFEPDEG